jgi:hypothetical protein
MNPHDLAKLRVAAAKNLGWADAAQRRHESPMKYGKMNLANLIENAVGVRPTNDGANQFLIDSYDPINRQQQSARIALDTVMTHLHQYHMNATDLDQHFFVALCAIGDAGKTRYGRADWKIHGKLVADAAYALLCS